MCFSCEVKLILLLYHLANLRYLSSPIPTMVYHRCSYDTFIIKWIIRYPEQRICQNLHPAPATCALN